MTTTMATIRKVFPALVAGVALIATGCAESTTKEDVADAREELQEQQQDVAEAQRDAQDEIADARQDATEHTASKPVTDDAAEARQDVAEARQDANEQIADEQQDVREAKAELRTEEQKLQATRARDAYVKEVESKLAAIENQIDQMEEEAAAAEGAEKDAINLRMEQLQAQHDRAEKALDQLKNADLAEWLNHRQHVRVALQELESNVR